MREGAIAALRGIGARVRTYPGAAVGVGIVTLLVLAVWILPPLLAGEGEAENDVRSTLLQGLAGLVLAAGLYFTAQTLRHNRESAARTFELAREGQITERFTRAIDQLGDEKLDVRLGGIYALERIAKSSTEDHGPIMEVLTAYVREHAPRPPRAEDEGEEPLSAEHREREEHGRPSTDVQAVIAVLGRRELGRNEHALDLSSVDLRHARFGKGPDEGHFEGANFGGARLEGADLDDAHLRRAYLGGANLTGAHLNRANLAWAGLEGANLAEAQLTLANLDLASLERAYLAGADVGEANLAGANLRGANFAGAKLAGADLEGASLTGANLDGANLTGARLTATVAGATLRGATLMLANLAGSDLEGANLEEAFLERTNLEGAYLERANLRGANLRGANLTGADLTGAELGGARYDPYATWPAGFDPKAKGARLWPNSE